MIAIQRDIDMDEISAETIVMLSAKAIFDYDTELKKTYLYFEEPNGELEFHGEIDTKGCRPAPFPQ